MSLAASGRCTLDRLALLLIGPRVTSAVPLKPTLCRNGRVIAVPGCLAPGRSLLQLGDTLLLHYWREIKAGLGVIELRYLIFEEYRLSRMD